MNGKLFVLSGPSGCGKSTVIQKVMEWYPNLKFSVSATTRPMRPGETDGVNYFFVSREKFNSMLENGELLEHVDYVNNSYGTPEAPLQAALEAGTDILLDIEPVGALNVKKKRPDATLMFLAPPSLKELERRLVNRGDTAPELIRGRLERSAWEMEQAQNYDYIIINDVIDTAAREVFSVITAEKCRAADRYPLIKEEQ